MDFWSGLVAIYQGFYGLIYDLVKDHTSENISSFKLSAFLLSCLAAINILMLELFFLKIFALNTDWKLPVFSVLLIGVFNFYYFTQTSNKIFVNLAYMSLSQEQKETLKTLLQILIIADVALLAGLYLI